MLIDNYSKKKKTQTKWKLCSVQMNTQQKLHCEKEPMKPPTTQVGWVVL